MIAENSPQPQTARTCRGAAAPTRARVAPRLAPQRAARQIQRARNRTRDCGAAARRRQVRSAARCARFRRAAPRSRRTRRGSEPRESAVAPADPSAPLRLRGDLGDAHGHQRPGARSPDRFPPCGAASAAPRSRRIRRSREPRESAGAPAARNRARVVPRLAPQHAARQIQRAGNRARDPKLIHYNKVPKGGHFAAWEQPKLYTDELRAGFRSLRLSSASQRFAAARAVSVTSLCWPATCASPAGKMPCSAIRKSVSD